MKSSVNQQKPFEAICRHLHKDEHGIWFADKSEKCFYPEDGEKRLVGIEEDSFWFQHRRNCIIEVVTAYPPDGWIMDIGGGNGFVTLGLTNAGFDAILLEPDRNAVMNAYRRGVTQIVCSTIESAGFESNSIPAVGIFDVLEHIEDDLSLLKKIRKILKTKGKLYITAPAFPFLWSKEDEYGKHFRRYTLHQVEQKLHQSGFQIEYKTYLFFYLPLPLFCVKTIPTKLGLAKVYTHEQTRQEHVIQSGLKKKMLDKLNAWELHRIGLGKRIPLGTSVLVAAYAC